MADPYLGEIRLTSFGYAPQGWALANGQILPINQNQALFAILGTTYGGNGQTTFALPDLRGRTPAHMGGGLTLGQIMGSEAHTLTINEIPPHKHQLNAVSDSGTNVNSPIGAYLANSSPAEIYRSSPASLLPVISNTIGGVGGSQPHTNLQPYLSISFMIALIGIFPSRN